MKLTQPLREFHTNLRSPKAQRDAVPSSMVDISNASVSNCWTNLNDLVSRPAPRIRLAAPGVQLSKVQQQIRRMRRCEIQPLHDHNHCRRHWAREEHSYTNAIVAGAEKVAQCLPNFISDRESLSSHRSSSGGAALAGDMIHTLATAEHIAHVARF